MSIVDCWKNVPPEPSRLTLRSLVCWWILATRLVVLETGFGGLGPGLMDPGAGVRGSRRRPWWILDTVLVVPGDGIGGPGDGVGVPSDGLGGS
ncbi:hypothetical protein N7476_009594 [Penicillium atrosanguineum]|uniref:Uncharacterized protein n=1 Tax=Penicillium atrosanguineum TaxID=1132637 RepID=A0A9W9PNK9_9EURO|nr:hypothetical protein N7476_009594 [Penicillium atrosanguineum]